MPLSHQEASTTGFVCLETSCKSGDLMGQEKASCVLSEWDKALFAYLLFFPQSLNPQLLCSGGKGDALSWIETQSCHLNFHTHMKISCQPKQHRCVSENFRSDLSPCYSTWSTDLAAMMPLWLTPGPLSQRAALQERICRSVWQRQPTLGSIR